MKYVYCILLVILIPFCTSCISRDVRRFNLDKQGEREYDEDGDYEETKTSIGIGEKKLTLWTKVKKVLSRQDFIDKWVTIGLLIVCGISVIGIIAAVVGKYYKQPWWDEVGVISVITFGICFTGLVIYGLLKVVIPAGVVSYLGYRGFKVWKSKKVITNG